MSASPPPNDPAVPVRRECGPEHGGKSFPQKVFSRSPSPFTLAELLTVIGIIAVLTGFLLPVLGSARARGRSSACLNSIRQVAFMHLLYTDVFNGVFCPAWDDRYRQWDASGDYTGPGILASALSGVDSGSGRVFDCPEARNQLYFNSHWTAQFAGFGYNYLMSFKDIGAFPPDYRAVRAGGLRRPAGILLLADAACFLSGTGGMPAPTAFLYNPGSGRGGYADFRHSGGANAVFADGHAENRKNFFRRPGDASGYGDRLGYLAADDRMYDPQ